MIGKLLDFIVGREPVAAATGLAGGVGALLGVLGAFDVWDPSPEQIGALTALAAWVAGYLARRVVTPVARVTPKEPQRGSVPLATILAVVFFLLLVGAFFATCDALFDDEDEPGDLGQAALVMSSYEKRDHDDERQSRNRNDCNQSENCSDDDQLVIIVCPEGCVRAPSGDVGG